MADLRRSATSADGALNPTKFLSWQLRRSAALRAFPEMQRPGLRKPITGIAFCCAHPASGAAVTPPMTAIRSRRLILLTLPSRPGSGWHAAIMRRKRYEGESGPATRGSTGKAHLVLRVWCEDCHHRADIDPAEQAKRHGADMDLLDWAKRLVCSQCGSRRVDFVVTPRSTGGI